MTRRVLMSMVMLWFALAACAPAAATDAVPASPTIPPTETLLPTQTPSPTVSPTGTATLAPTETFTPEPSPTFTSVPYLPPASTRKPARQQPPDNPTPTNTATVTLEPSPTFCPLPTPEPLWVEAVTSPTDQLSQIITVHVGYGTQVTISAESGTFTATGSFGVYVNPALVEITLLPNTVHHLEVSANIQPPPSNGCTYGSYTLQTTLDQNGVPLVIAQGAAVP